MAYKRQSPQPVPEGGTNRSTIAAHNLMVGNDTNQISLVAPSGTPGVAVISSGPGSDPTYGTVVVAGGGTGRAALINHNLLVGAGTSPVNFIAPAATAGVPLVSTGAVSDPAFGTAVVAGGGTGKTSFTPYTVITAGTTATAPLSNVAGTGTLGQVLTSQGAGAYPIWTTISTGGGCCMPTLLETQSIASTDSVIFDNTHINSTYSSYLVTLANARITNNSMITVFVSEDNGATYKNATNAQFYGTGGGALSNIEITPVVLNSSIDLNIYFNKIGASYYAPQIVSVGSKCNGTYTYSIRGNHYVYNLSSNLNINCIKIMTVGSTFEFATVKLWGCTCEWWYYMQQLSQEPIYPNQFLT